jgi:hypothetical protein
MKKLTIILFVSFLLLGFHSISAAQKVPAKNTNQNVTGVNFIDKNNDGICDNNGTRGVRASGRNYADKNKDGICDNLATGNRGNGKGFRNGSGKGCGNGARQYGRKCRR